MLKEEIDPFDMCEGLAMQYHQIVMSRGALKEIGAEMKTFSRIQKCRLP